MHKRNTAGIKLHAKHKSEQAFNKANLAIKELQKSGKPITFAAVSRLAAVSTAWLYKQDQIREKIYKLRNVTCIKNNSYSQ